MSKKTLMEFKDAVCTSSADFCGGFHFDADAWVDNGWEDIADTCAKLARNAYRLSCSLASYSAHARRRTNENAKEEEVE